MLSRGGEELKRTLARWRSHRQSRTPVFILMSDEVLPRIAVTGTQARTLLMVLQETFYSASWFDVAAISDNGRVFCVQLKYIIAVTRHISNRNFRKWNLTSNHMCLLFNIEKHAVGKSCLSHLSNVRSSPVLLASFRRCCCLAAALVTLTSNCFIVQQQSYCVISLFSFISLRFIFLVLSSFPSSASPFSFRIAVYVIFLILFSSTIFIFCLLPFVSF